MIDIKNESGRIVLSVDTTIYDCWVIDKVLYWWTRDFVISRNNDEPNHLQRITLEPKCNGSDIDFQSIKERISTDFIDYKNRQTIAKETANIRDLLFAKAFANNDDFVEFTFQD